MKYDKKEAGVLVKGYLDKLLQNQVIDQKVYDKAVKKFAAGGAVVQNPLELAAAVAQQPQISTQDPVLAQKIAEAEANTVKQAEAQVAPEQVEAQPQEQGVLDTAKNVLKRAVGITPEGGQPTKSFNKTVNDAVLNTLGFSGLTGQDEFKEENIPTTVQAQKKTPDVIQASDQQQMIPQQQRMQGFEQIQQAIDMGAQQGAQAAAAESSYLRNIEKDLQIKQKEDAIREQELSKFRQEQQAKITKMNEEAIAASQIDPNRFWNSRSSSQKVLAYIGLLLGGSASAQILDKAIDQDIEAQKSNFNIKQQGVANTMNLYKQNLEAFQDERSASLATKQTMLGIADMKIKQLAAQTQSNQVKQNAMIESAKLNMEMQKVQRELNQQLLTQSVLSQGTGKAAENAVILSRLPEDVRERAVVSTTGKILISATKDDAKKLKELEQSIPGLLERVKQIKGTADKKGKAGFQPNPYSREGQDAIAIRNNLITDIKNAETLGALDKGLVEFAEELIPDPTIMNQVKVKAAYDAIEKRFKNNLERARSVYSTNYRPIVTKDAME
jgi:hypothetical protein